jgi:hypothetical protein
MDAISDSRDLSETSRKQGPMAAARVIRSRRLSDLAVAHYSSSTSRLSRLRQTDDSWTAIRHRSRLCQSPSSAAWLSLRGASPEDRPRSSRSARRRRRRFGLHAHQKMVEAHFERTRRPVDNGRPVDQHWSPQRWNPATRVSQFHAHDLSRSASLICLFDELPCGPVHGLGWSVEKRM